MYAFSAVHRLLDDFRKFQNAGSLVHLSRAAQSLCQEGATVKRLHALMRRNCVTPIQALDLRRA